MVYDVTQDRTYSHLDKWKQNFAQATSLEGMPFVILGNKSDLGARVNPNRVRADWIERGYANCHY